MKVILTIWISAALLQEVVPSTLVRYPRNAANTPSYLHTEYEAKIEQKGKHGNESFGTLSGKQAIEHDNCNDDWNAFANKCAGLIKDLVASLANAVSSKPGDATNLQLHIKNTFRHLDKTHNCSCLNQTGRGLSDMDLSHLFDNLTLSTTAPDGNNDESRPRDDESYEGHSSLAGGNRRPKKPATDTAINPEDEDDPNSRNNNRRQTKQEPVRSNNIVTDSDVPQRHKGQKNGFHPFLTTPLPSYESSRPASDTLSTIPPFYGTNRHPPPKSSSSKKTSTPNVSKGYSSGSPRQQQENKPTTEVPVEIENTENQTPSQGNEPEHTETPQVIQAQIPVATENSDNHNSQPSNESVEHNRPRVESSRDRENNDDEDDELKSESSEHGTSARPRHEDDSSKETDSDESPDDNSSIPSVPIHVQASKDSQPTAIPVTNSDSNIPESSEPTTGHNSLSSGPSQSPSDQNSDAVTESGRGRSSDAQQTTARDETTKMETVTMSTIPVSEDSEHEEREDEILITPRPVTGSRKPAAENRGSGRETTAQTETAEPVINKEGSRGQSQGAEEEWSTTPQTVYPTDERTQPERRVGVSNNAEETGTTESDGEEMRNTPEPISVGSSGTNNEEKVTSRPQTNPVRSSGRNGNEQGTNNEETIPIESSGTNGNEQVENSPEVVPEGSSGTNENEQETNGSESTPVGSSGTNENKQETNGPEVVPGGSSGTNGNEQEKNGPESISVGSSDTNNGEQEKSSPEVVPVESSQTNDDGQDENEKETPASVTESSTSPVEGTGMSEGSEGHTEVSENPVLEQPTTFQTTSEDPTPPPVSSHSSPEVMTAVTSRQESDEGTTSERKEEEKNEKHHGREDEEEEDDEEDCCSCESCTEEEEADAKKVRENVCKSLEEARKELKAIFDKIKKKLRCCRKMPHTIMTNSSPLPH